MVTIQNAVQYVNGVACTTQKIWCKSTDVKPTEGIGNGSQLREMDTGKDYAFDAENGEWLEQPSEGGGGGGGGGGSSALSGLTDVDISNPADGQTLVYNATSGKWENGAGAGGGGVHSIGAQTVEGKTALTVTAGQLFGWLQNGDYVVLRVNQSESVGVFKPISEYEFTTEDGYGFNFGGNWYVAYNADDYPVGVA